MDISLEPPLEKTFGVINLPNKDPSVIAALLSFVYKDTYSHDLCRTVHASSYQSDLGANVESTAHLGSPKEVAEISSESNERDEIVVGRSMNKATGAQSW